MTNDDLLELDATPARVAVLGAGRFSVEWADFLQEAGAQVTLISPAERVLPQEDARPSSPPARSSATTSPPTAP